jgi:hypothetical protein
MYYCIDLFFSPIPRKLIVGLFLIAPQLKELKDAIEADYFFEMLIDDLPIWGYLGEVIVFKKFLPYVLDCLLDIHQHRLGRSRGIFTWKDIPGS